MRKLCPPLLLLALLAGCSATHSTTGPRPTARPTTSQAQHPEEPTAPPSTRAAVAAKPAASTDPRPPGSTSEAGSSATARITVRPVTSAGEPVAGYRVTDERYRRFECFEPSPVAVSPGIAFCGFSATNTVACWRSSLPSTVLCLREPLRRALVRITYTGAFTATVAPAHPTAQALVLDDGTSCLIRDGGAWSAVPSQPTWYGWYFCGRGVNVYGPIAGRGIDRTRPVWTVHTVAGDGQIGTHAVTSAYFVGTA